MLLRPRQQELVDRAVTALHQHGNTLAVAPTGAGKTIMLSSVIGALCKSSTAKTCVVAHRDELTAQNEAKFRRVNPHLSTSVFDASEKSWQGDTTFAMVQTLSRYKNLMTMPPLDLLAIDEAHHARAETYVRIVEHAKSLNPNLKLLGVTATPNRGDKRGLGTLFDNVCDQIFFKDLMDSGHLVRPRTFVMDAKALEKFQDLQIGEEGEFDMVAAAGLMDTKPQNKAVVAHWKEKAGDRQTVVFCSTVDHAWHVYHAFIREHIKAVLIHGKMDKGERDEALQTYVKGQAQVIVNVSVLIEGWDHPPTSCIVLLRPCAHHATFIQMVGRGLRPVNLEEYPGVVKTDCLILDFGNASLLHGKLEQIVILEDGQTEDEKEAEDKKTLPQICPECKEKVFSLEPECPECGYKSPEPEQKEHQEGSLKAEDFSMREIDLLEQSCFEWLSLGEDQQTLMASGLKAWSRLVFRDGQWHAIGGLHKEKTHLLAIGDKATCFTAADDWMNRQESDDRAHKTRSWLTLPPTPNQLRHLPDHENDYNLTRYEAALLITLKFKNDEIETVLSQGNF